MPWSDKMMYRCTLRRLVFNASLVIFLLLFIYFFLPCKRPYTRMDNIKMRTIYDRSSNKTFVYDRSMPLIFIGGVPRSGTTLMRAILDAHPDIRCGEETRVIPRIIGLRNNMFKSKRETERLFEAGIDDSVLDSAMSAFILEIIARHGEPANRLCNKDPLTMKSTTYIARLFPNAKFILMLRDGRAVVHSIITRKVTITGFDLKSYEKCLKSWNNVVENMFMECERVGGSVCLKVHYEQLVLHPRVTVDTVLKFLDIPWNEAVMKHEEFIGKPGGISLSKTERSTSQVIKPVNLNALSSWVGSIPNNVVADMPVIAPMLGILGYDPRANPPKYGDPDHKVSENTIKVRENPDYWRLKEQAIAHGIGIKANTEKTKVKLIPR